MQLHRLALTLSLVALFFLPCAMAARHQSDPASPRVSMNNHYLERLLREMTEDVRGEEGRWEFELWDVSMILVTDEANGRMRVMAPIVSVDELAPHMPRFLMEVNFDRALDAKYAIWRETLWGVFVHSLNDLSEAEFREAVRQVANLKRNFGTTFASTEIVLGEGDGGR